MPLYKNFCVFLIYCNNIPWPLYQWVCGLVLCEAVSGTIPLIPPLVSYQSWTMIFVPMMHRVGSKLFLQSSHLELPHPLSRRRVCPPPPPFLVRVGGHTCLRERGWGSPNSDEGTYTVVLCILKVLCAMMYKFHWVASQNILRLPAKKSRMTQRRGRQEQHPDLMCSKWSIEFYNNRS